MKQSKRYVLLLTSSILILIISGCMSSTGSYTSKEFVSKPYIGPISEKTLAYEGLERNPLIVVHGFRGASLIDIKTNQNIWGTFYPAEVVSISDSKMRSLMHPLGYNKKLKDLKDDVIADKLLETIKITFYGVQYEESAYDEMIEVLIKGGYVPENRPLPEGKNYPSMFLFAYDWRRDLPESAAKLSEFIKEKRTYMQKVYEEQYGVKDYNVQFDIICHSMGGLVSRYYLRYGNQDLPDDGTMPNLNWAGNVYLDRLIIVGTPNAGYMDTFLELLRGAPLQPYPLMALGTLPAYYQMLPAPNTMSFLYSDDPDGEPFDIFDPFIWEKMSWGIANPEGDKILKILLPDVSSKKERRKIALDHLSKCLNRAKQFIKAMEIQASPPKDIKLYLVYGYGIKTTKCVLINRKTGKVDSIAYGSGDGKVLASSALWDRRVETKWTPFINSPINWSGITVLRAAHMAITKEPTFEDNIIFMLTMEETEKHKKDLAKIRKLSR